MHSVLVVGHGNVGTAVSSIFKKDRLDIADIKLNKFIYDYRYKKYDLIFVCVDTPEGDNFRMLDQVLFELNNQFKTIVVSKSTASPSYYRDAQSAYKNIKLLHSPEYLNHWNPLQSFKEQEFIIMGGDLKAAKKALDIIKPRMPKVKSTHITDIETAALVKYAENAFLSLRVTFANEFYNIHKKLGLKSSFEEFIHLLGQDKRIGSSHFQVPGPDKMFGWGGHCFDKDMAELKRFSNSDLVDYIVKLNKIHRSETIQTKKQYSRLSRI